MTRAYPSTKTRILRARELGIRAAAAGMTHRANPYHPRNSGLPLWRAWTIGDVVGGPDIARQITGWPGFPVIDLTSEFRSLCVLLDATLPESWPRRAS